MNEHFLKSLSPSLMGGHEPPAPLEVLACTRNCMLYVSGSYKMTEKIFTLCLPLHLSKRKSHVSNSRHDSYYIYIAPGNSRMHSKSKRLSARYKPWAGTGFLKATGPGQLSGSLRTISTLFGGNRALSVVAFECPEFFSYEKNDQ